MYLQIVGHIFSVTLSGGGAVKTCAYVPTDGGSDSDEVTESIPVILESTTGGVRSVINTLNQIGEYARRRATNGVGGRVYLNYKPISSDAATFRSEVLDLRWAWSDDPALRRFEDANPSTLIFNGVLVVRRRNYWEGSRTAIPLTNGNGAGNTSGLTVWAHDDVDSGHDAYAFTTGANISGDMPAPLEIRLKNNSGSLKTYANFWLANNDFASTMAHIIEGELRSTGGTVTSSASASAGITPGTGQMVRVTVSAGSTVVIWSLSAALLQQTNGNAFRILGRFLQISSTVYATLQLRSGSARVDSNEVEVRLGSTDNLQDLGVLALPPGGWGVASYGSIDLYLYLRCAGSATVDLDYLVLLPAEPRMLRHLRVEGGYSAAANDIIVDDGPEERRYIDTGVNQYSAVSAEGPALHVVPGVDQRIYIAHDGTGIDLNSTLAVQMFYRPRRRTL